jgi:hypothetical protein
MIINNIRNDRQLKANIGLSFEEWHQLSLLFEEVHQDIYGVSLENKFNNLKKTPFLKTGKEVVFFVLFQLKNALTYDVLGAIFGMNTSNAQRNFKTYLPLIRLALNKRSLLPSRNFESLEWNKLLEQENEICIDAAEIPVQRPVNQQDKKQLYSKKKRASTKVHHLIR